MIDILEARGYVIVPREQFEKLCRFHTAFAQEYRIILGMNPLPTNSQQKKNSHK